RAFVIAASALLGSAAALAHAGGLHVGVTISGSLAPGVYGEVHLGNGPRPALVYAQPMIIAAPAGAVRLAPIYLHVPPEHARHWRRYCHIYHACDRPVYFVRTAEYAPGYVPPPRVHHHDQGRSHEHRDDHAYDRGRGHDHDRADHHDQGRDADRGRGHESDHGHDRSDDRHDGG
ncbi:MAG: hypothetical protein ACRET2_15115, partial [Steroidobacteraceae bacterium]